MRARLLLPTLALTAALALAACGSDDETITDSEPTTPTTSGPLVTFAKGGGFAPVSQELVIERDGTGTATATFPTEKPEERTAEFTLSAAELTELTDAVDSTPLQSFPMNGACADCFTYSINTDQGSTDFDEAMLDGFGDEDPIVSDDVAELYELLAPLLAEHVPGPDPGIGG